MTDNNGWAEYKLLVVKQLEDLTNCIEKLETKINLMREDIIILKVKAGLFGIMGGAIAAALLQFLFNGK